MLLSWEDTRRNPAYDIKQEFGWEIQKHDCNMISILVLIIFRQRMKNCTAFRTQLWSMRGSGLSVRHLILATPSKMFPFFKLTFLEFIPTALPPSFLVLPQTELSNIYKNFRYGGASQLLIFLVLHWDTDISPFTQAWLSQSWPQQNSPESCALHHEEILDISFILEPSASKPTNYSWIRAHISHEHRHLSPCSKSTGLVQGLCIQSSAMVISRIYPG